LVSSFIPTSIPESNDANWASQTGQTASFGSSIPSLSLMRDAEEKTPRRGAQVAKRHVTAKPFDWKVHGFRLKI
jgi:hypothetical protein